MENFDIDTTYADLMAAVVPPGMYPEVMLIMVADLVMDMIPIEQARFMLVNIRQFDEEFGPGEYIKLNLALTGALTNAIASLPPAQLMQMTLKMAEMQGVDLPFGPSG